MRIQDWINRGFHVVTLLRQSTRDYRVFSDSTLRRLADPLCPTSAGVPDQGRCVLANTGSAHSLVTLTSRKYTT